MKAGNILKGLLGLSGASALVLDTAEKPETAKGDGYVLLPIAKSRGDRFEDSVKGVKPHAKLVKRGNDYVEVEIKNANTFYSLSLSIGSPPQEVTVLVDTGSSDLWVTGSDVKCGPDNNIGFPPLNCSEYGLFNKEKSSTWKSNNTDFLISYGDTTFASGVWGTDELHFGDVNASGLSFAVANASNSSVAVLGIGLTANEVTRSGLNGYEYDNLPNVLKRNNVIAKSAYSLFINEPSAHGGNVLFGAVDHKKYSGQLSTVPLISSRGPRSKPTEFFITLNGLGVTSQTGQSTITTTKFPALLDSGTTFSYFPQDLANLIARSIGAVWRPEISHFLINCSKVERNNINLVYDFGGIHINSPISDYLLETNAADVCALAFVPSPAPYIILGDVFLTSAYVVYDLESLEISLAQAVHTDAQDIEPIRSTVPGAVKAPQYSSTYSTIMPLSTGGNIFTNVQENGTQISTTTTSNSRARNVAGAATAPSKWTVSIPASVLVGFLSLFI